MERLRSVTLTAEVDTNKFTHTETFELTGNKTPEELVKELAEWLYARLELN